MSGRIWTFILLLLIIPNMILAARIGDSGHQIVSVFDFEERDIHFQDIPMFWNKIVGREGFPHYSRGALSDDLARSGEYSFKLISDGGSV
ncbi:MAG: hypothetical protein JXM68_03365, partial [Sedimentisphaerales bacterium]|nr:hypothetical protein [Sedimentisphaerales bacterium]